MTVLSMMTNYIHLAKIGLKCEEKLDSYASFADAICFYRRSLWLSSEMTVKLKFSLAIIFLGSDVSVTLQ